MSLCNADTQGKEGDNNLLICVSNLYITIAIIQDGFDFLNFGLNMISRFGCDIL